MNSHHLWSMLRSSVSPPLVKGDSGGFEIFKEGIVTTATGQPVVTISAEEIVVPTLLWTRTISKSVFRRSNPRTM